MMYFEDIETGARIELGSFAFSAEDIIRFARDFDPQPFHLSEEGAAASHFGRLCASGWHTAAVWMKLMVTFQKSHARERLASGLPLAKMGPSPGFDDLKWLKPVYAGDTITYSSTITGKTELKSKPDWGLASMLNEGVNQSGDVVFSFVGHVFVERRPA